MWKQSKQNNKQTSMGGREAKAYFKTIKIRYWWLALMAFLCAGCVFGFYYNPPDMNASYMEEDHVETLAVALIGKTIIIDAGHGGFDPGAIGVSGVKEKDVNLAIAKRLAAYLKQAGVTVIETRPADNALADTKKGDMARRKEIAEENNADIFISVQANRFPQQQYRGAQVFYHKQSEEGKALATNIQDEIKANLKNTTRVAMPIDNVYVVRSLAIPSIVVEVGFLSNPEEEKLLENPAYQDQMAYNIFLGIIKFYSDNPDGIAESTEDAESENIGFFQRLIQKHKAKKAEKELRELLPQQHEDAILYITD